MHTTSQEFQSVAAAGPRFDMYGGIHKALRAFIADTLAAVGRMDPADEQEIADISARVLQLLGVCSGHVAHENQFVHAAIEARAAGGSEAVAHEHDEHLRHIAELAQLVAVLQGCVPEHRALAAQRLYRALALFLADNLRHMEVEESSHNALLWARYTDAELVAIHDALVASIPPQEMGTIARWLVPALNPVERVMLLADLRGKAPAPLFEGLLELVRPHLSTGEWAKLARGLGLPPVPGLVA